MWKCLNGRWPILGLLELAWAGWRQACCCWDFNFYWDGQRSHWVCWECLDGSVSLITFELHLGSHSLLDCWMRCLCCYHHPIDGHCRTPNPKSGHFWHSCEFTPARLHSGRPVTSSTSSYWKINWRFSHASGYCFGTRLEPSPLRAIACFERWELPADSVDLKILIGVSCLH